MTSIYGWSIELDQLVRSHLFVVVGIISPLSSQALRQGVNCVQILFRRLDFVSHETKLSLSGIVNLFLLRLFL